MALSTWMGDRLTFCGFGRKPLFMLGLVTLPIRCALIIFWKDAGNVYLLSTQILDGLGAGLCGLVHPYLVADLTFGTGRFNVVSTSACFCFVSDKPFLLLLLFFLLTPLFFFQCNKQHKQQQWV
jgi:hypothetical protein